MCASVCVSGGNRTDRRMRKRGTRARSFKRGKPIARLVVPYAAGVLRRTVGRCMIDLTRGAPDPTSHVPGVLRLRTLVRDPCTNPRVQLRTDNPVTGQHREQCIVGNLSGEKGDGWWIRRSGIDWNYTQGLQSGFGYRTALGLLWVAGSRQYAKTNSTSGFGAICRTKYLAARGCVEISIAGGSADQKRQAPGSARTVLAIPPRDFIAES